MPIRADKRRKKRKVFVGVLGLVMIGILGATSSLASVEASTTATVARTSDYISLDFQTTANSGVQMAEFPAYDRLVGFSKDAQKVVPYLATKWVMRPATRPKSITFTLRKDAKCTDGAAVTPLVVLNSFKRWIQAPKVGGNPLVNFFGPGPYHLSVNNKGSTFTFRTETPYANMLVGFAQAGIICPAGIEALKSDPQALTKAQYGSGPYTLISAAPGDKVVWKKRSDWKWGPPGTDIKNMPDTLIHRNIPNASTLANSLLTGEVDMAMVLGPDVPRLTNSSLVKKVGTNYYSFALKFNMNRGRITTDEKVREALMTAVDPKAYAQVAFQGRATIAPSIIHPSLKCYDPEVVALAPKPSLARARQILTSAGWVPNSNGILTKDGKPLHIFFISNTDWMANGGDYIAGMWKQLGIDVEQLNTGGALPGQTLVAQNWDAAVAWSLFTAPVVGVGIANSSGPPPPTGTNFGFIGGGNPDYDKEAFLAIQYTGCEHWNKYQELTLKGHYMLPLAFPAMTLFGNKKFDFPLNLNFVEPEWITKR